MTDKMGLALRSGAGMLNLRTLETATVCSLLQVYCSVQPKLQLLCNSITVMLEKSRWLYEPGWPNCRALQLAEADT